MCYSVRHICIRPPAERKQILFSNRREKSFRSILNCEKIYLCIFGGKLVDLTQNFSFELFEHIHTKKGKDGNMNKF